MSANTMKHLKRALHHLEQSFHDVDFAGLGLTHAGWKKSQRLMAEIMSVRKRVASLRTNVTRPQTVGAARVVRRVALARRTSRRSR